MPERDGGAAADPREAWRVLAANYHLFRGTPSRIWLDWVFREVFGLEVLLTAETSDLYFERISDDLERDEFRPRASFGRFNIEVNATRDRT